MDADQAEMLAAVRANTKSNQELSAEVRRLVDVFGKVISMEPPKRIDGGSTVDIGEVAGKATVAALGALFGSGRRKK